MIAESKSLKKSTAELKFISCFLRKQKKAQGSQVFLRKTFSQAAFKQASVVCLFSPKQNRVCTFRKLPRTTQDIWIQIICWTLVPSTLFKHDSVGPESSLKSLHYEFKDAQWCIFYNTCALISSKQQSDHFILGFHLGLLKLRFFDRGWSGALSSKKPNEIVSPAQLRGVSTPGRQVLSLGFCYQHHLWQVVPPSSKEMLQLAASTAVASFWFQGSKFCKTFC